MNARLRLILVAALLAATSTALLAQYALDANLRRGGSRVNPHSPRQAMAKPLYTTSRRTGRLAYNRANAFNDSAYSIHQRYTGNRTQYFDPTRGRSSAALTHRSAAPAAPRTLDRSSYSVAANPRRRNRPASASGTISMRAPSTRTSGGVSLLQSQYSAVSTYGVASTRTRR